MISDIYDMTSDIQDMMKQYDFIIISVHRFR